MSLNIEVLKQSSEQIKLHAAKFSASFYNTLFEDYPQTRPLFVKTNLARQQKKLIKALLLALKNLHNSDFLALSFKELGAKYVQYGVLPEHYSLFGATLLKTSRFYLGSDWTPEVRQAWAEAYAVIASLMLEGAQSSRLNAREAII